MDRTITSLGTSDIDISLDNCNFNVMENVLRQSSVSIVSILYIFIETTGHA